MRGRALTWLNHRLVKPVGSIAAVWRGTLGRRTRVVAVTGTFGKSTTTRAVIAALGMEDPGIRSNSHARLLRNLIAGTGRAPWCVLEVGIGGPGQMHRYARVLRPDIAVVTMVAAEHEKQFPDGVDGIQREKGELVARLPADGVAVLNADDPRTLAMAERTEARVVTFGRSSDADVRLLDLRGTIRGSSIRVRLGAETHELDVRLVGRTVATPFLAALAVVHAAGRPVPAAIARLEALAPSSRRMEPVSLPGGVSVVLDDWKNNPITAHAAFDFMADLSGGRRIGVLGNLPLGTSQRDQAFRDVGDRAGRSFDRIYLTCLSDDEFSLYRDSLLATGFPESELVRLPGVHETAELLRRELAPNDLVLVKGHFTDQLSRIVLLLQDVPVRCRRDYCMVKTNLWCDTCPAVFEDMGGEHRRRNAAGAAG